MRIYRLILTKGESYQAEYAGSSPFGPSNSTFPSWQYCRICSHCSALDVSISDNSLSTELPPSDQILLRLSANSASDLDFRKPVKRGSFWALICTPSSRHIAWTSYHISFGFCVLISLCRRCVRPKRWFSSTSSFWLVFVLSWLEISISWKGTTMKRTARNAKVKDLSTRTFD